MMKYEIIDTGRNNAVVIGDVLVDCGTSFKRIREYLYDVKFLLITHAHSDHLNLSTYRLIRKEFPYITVLSNEDVAMVVDVDIVVRHHQAVEFKGKRFIPFQCVHDVLTFGFSWVHEGRHIIYATDTASLEGAPEAKYDFMFLECHHDEERLRMAAETYDMPELMSSSKIFHLSRQKCHAFHQKHKSETGILIELHPSSDRRLI